MRLRIRWLLIIALASVFVTATRDSWSTWLASLVRQLRAGPLLPETTMSQAYRVPEDDWLEFPVPREGTVLRIMTNANLSEPPADDVPLDQRPELRYALAYQVLDGQGRVLDQGDYHFRTQTAAPRPIGDGTAYALARYAEGHPYPAATRTMLYPVTRQRDRAARLRLRVRSQDPEILDVTARIYLQQENKAYQRQYLWQRVSAGRKQTLCRGSVYPVELVSAFERQNLVRWEWTPLTPDGIEGLDYQRRTLYTRSDLEGLVLDEEILPAGLLVRRGRRAMVPLPESAGRLRIQSQSRAGPNGAFPGCELDLRWYGKRPPRQESFHFALSRPDDELQIPLDGGLLEIEATQELVIRAFWQAAGAAGEAETEITPQPEYLRCYQAHAGQHVDYAVGHVDQQSTPFRVWLRRSMEPPPASPGQPPVESLPLSFRWQFLDQLGTVLDEGQVTATATRSAYDYVAEGRADQDVSDPAVYYFALPPAAQRIRFQSLEHPLLIAGFSRPPTLTKQVRVPEDYYAFHRADSLRRTWFSLRPDEHQRLQQEDRSVRVVIQTRPAAEDPEIAAGNFQWQDFYPPGQWIARYALVARDPTARASAEAFPVTFSQLQPNMEYHVQFQKEPGRLQIQPTLIYQARGPLPQDLAVYVDGKLHDQVRVYGPCGDLLLPPLPAAAALRPCRLKIIAAATTQVFVNRLDPADRPVFLKRLLQRFEDSELVFEYEKLSAGEEWLKLQVFRPSGGDRDGRLQLHVALGDPPSRGAGPHTSWTLLDRTFDVPHEAESTVLVLGTDRNSVNGLPACVLPLGDDLKPGKYLIRVACPSEADRYVLLSRVLPDRGDRRRVFLDQRGDQVLSEGE